MMVLNHDSCLTVQLLSDVDKMNQGQLCKIDLGGSCFCGCEGKWASTCQDSINWCTVTVAHHFITDVSTLIDVQACGQEKECISLYKHIEKTHPNSKIRKQAYELRYIMEAPRLQISEDERVKIPLLEDSSRYVWALWDLSEMWQNPCFNLVAWTDWWLEVCVFSTALETKFASRISAGLTLRIVHALPVMAL